MLELSVEADVHAGERLAGLGRGGLMFTLIIWLQGIYLPMHGYGFSR